MITLLKTLTQIGAVDKIEFFFYLNNLLCKSVKKSQNVSNVSNVSNNSTRKPLRTV